MVKVSSIVQELEELEQKRNEISTVLNESAYGEASIVLDRELDKYRKKVDTYLNAEFQPVSTVIYLSASAVSNIIDVDSTTQLEVIATLSDGTTKDVTSQYTPVMLFRDYDDLSNNVGYITSVDISSYVGEETTFRIVKTSSGFNVIDHLDTQGLHVVATANTNEYSVVDINGDSIGIIFTTDGNEATEDNWLIDIYQTETGTTYASSDPSVLEVNESGLVTAVGGGSADIIIRNGVQEVTHTIEVTDTVAPEPPSITSLTEVSGGAEVAFDTSTSPDVDYYNILVDGSVVETSITESPAFVSLTADGTTYSITMTAVDGSGNESIESNVMTITPTS